MLLFHLFSNSNAVELGFHLKTAVENKTSPFLASQACHMRAPPRQRDETAAVQMPKHTAPHMILRPMQGDPGSRDDA
jgi:hypothetical protein